jgi:carboxylesterase type B
LLYFQLQNEFIGDRLALFSPTVEAVNDSSAFLAEHPRRLLEEGRVANPVPWIVGVNSEEGLIYAANAIKNKTQRNMVNDNWKKIAPLVFYYDENPDHGNISAKIRDFYFNGGNINMNTLEETVNMFSDREFFEGKLHPHNVFARNVTHYLGILKEISH